MTINNVIRSRRTELNLSLKEVAAAVGVSESAVSRWESGDISNIRSDRVAKLAEILDISPLKLIGSEQSDPQESVQQSNEQTLKDNDSSVISGNRYTNREQLINIIMGLPDDKIAALLALLK